MSTVPPEVLPPAAAPLPSLKAADVVDPPLPAVANLTPPPQPDAAAQAPSSAAKANVADVVLSLAAILVLAMLSAGH